MVDTPDGKSDKGREEKSTTDESKSDETPETPDAKSVKSEAAGSAKKWKAKTLNGDKTEDERPAKKSKIEKGGVASGASSCSGSAADHWYTVYEWWDLTGYCAWAMEKRLKSRREAEAEYEALKDEMGEDDVKRDKNAKIVEMRLPIGKFGQKGKRNAEQDMIEGCSQDIKGKKVTLEALRDVRQEFSHGGQRGMDVHKGGDKEKEATDERLAAKKAVTVKQPKKKAKIQKKGSTDSVAGIADEEDDDPERKKVIKDLPAEKIGVQATIDMEIAEHCEGMEKLKIEVDACLKDTNATHAALAKMLAVRLSVYQTCLGDNESDAEKVITDLDDNEEALLPASKDNVEL